MLLSHRKDFQLVGSAGHLFCTQDGKQRREPKYSIYLLFRVKTESASNAALAAHDVCTVDTPGGITRIDHQLRLLDNTPVIVVGVVGHDQHTVVLAQVV